VDQMVHNFFPSLLFAACLMCKVQVSAGDSEWDTWPRLWKTVEGKNHYMITKYCFGVTDKDIGGGPVGEFMLKLRANGETRPAGVEVLIFDDEEDSIGKINVDDYNKEQWEEASKDSTILDKYTVDWQGDEWSMILSTVTETSRPRNWYLILVADDVFTVQYDLEIYNKGLYFEGSGPNNCEWKESPLADQLASNTKMNTALAVLGVVVVIEIFVLWCVCIKNAREARKKNTPQSAMDHDMTASAGYEDEAKEGTV